MHLKYSYGESRGVTRLRQPAANRLCLLHELRFQLHRADAVDLAVDIVGAFRADVNASVFSCHQVLDNGANGPPSFTNAQ